MTYILLLLNPADAGCCLKGSADDTGCRAFSSLLPVASRALQFEQQTLGIDIHLPRKHVPRTPTGESRVQGMFVAVSQSI
jgi:hypothetical protein